MKMALDIDRAVIYVTEYSNAVRMCDLKTGLNSRPSLGFALHEIVAFAF
jgi:hypothetical protein